MTAATRNRPTMSNTRDSASNDPPHFREDFPYWLKRGFASDAGAPRWGPRAPGASRPARTPTAPRSQHEADPLDPPKGAGLS